MKDEEKAELIKVLEVVDYHLMVQHPNYFDNGVLITDADLSYTGLNFYQFGWWLGHLQLEEYIVINEATNPKVEHPMNPTADEMYYLQHGTNVVFNIDLKNDFSGYFDELRYGKVSFEKIGKLDFTPKTSTLSMNDHKIKISQRQEPSNGHHLLTYIFAKNERLSDINDYADIAKEKFDGAETKPQTLWRACREINDKVQEAVSIPDFLIFSHSPRGNVRINPKYLPETLG